jgi:hypothetical protein
MSVRIDTTAVASSSSSGDASGVGGGKSAAPMPLPMNDSIVGSVNGSDEQPRPPPAYSTEL